MTSLARTTAAAGAVLGPAAAGADALVGRLPGAARRQRESLRHHAHRPWALPDARWVMAQSWVDLLFCHWPVDEAQLRAHVPASLPLDRFDGRAWLSITPFEVQGTRPRGALPPPVLSRFPELNVRTYVVRDGKPGIWFFSLDAASALAVAAARGLYRLPYLRARMRIARDGGWIDYRSERSDPRGEPARFDARYRGTGGVRHAEPGSLEAWLVERYRLYTVDDAGRVFAGDIHHRPWTLQDAVLDLRANTMTAPHGIALDDAPLVQFARRQDVVFWPLRHLAADGAA
jgi:uncharacterized protein YqjF (DUF2071 family)